MFKVKQEYNDRIISHLRSLGLCTSDSRKHQIHTLTHKQAFIALTMELGLNVTMTTLLHDTDKLVLYGRMDKQEASKLHREFSTHHFHNCETEDDLIQCVVDYECSRLTKKNKNISAYDYIITRTEEYYRALKPTLVNLGLDEGSNLDNKFEAWNRCNRKTLRHYIDINIKAITVLNEAIDTLGEREAVRKFYAMELKI